MSEANARPVPTRATASPTNDPFGRSGFVRLLASRSDTSGIGTMLFGPGVRVERGDSS